MVGKKYLFLGLLILNYYSLNAQESDKISLDKISLVTLEGKPIALEQYKGKIVFLNFWATWCKPCIYEIPNIIKAKEKLSEEEIVFLLASEEGLPKIRKFKQKNGYKIDFVKLKSSFRENSINYVPTTLLIDKEGSIINSYIGYKVWNSRAEINKLLKYTR